MEKEEALLTGVVKIGNSSIEFEVPSSLYKAIQEHSQTRETIKLFSYNSDPLIEIARSLIPKDKRPPTHKQEVFANKIASTLNIPLPKEVLISIELCSQYISQHVDLYNEIEYQIRIEKDIIKANNKEINRLASLATKVNKWFLASSMISRGVPIEEVADSFGVKPPTIRKYCNSFDEWGMEALQNNTYDMIFELIEKINAGEDIFVEYTPY